MMQPLMKEISKMKLVTKKKQMDDKRILEAYHASSKTAEEIVAFLNAEK